jgi:hypothetical protein
MNSDIIIYQNSDGNIKIDVRLEDETVWLTQDQMATLFGKAKFTINEHIKNVYEEQELEESAMMKKFGISEFQQKAFNYYNLDVIISVGYRVKSAQGKQFRIWATQRLDSLLQLNGRELLTHAGKVSHEIAFKKSGEEFEKYKIVQKAIEKEQSLKEIEEDLKKIGKG